MERGNVETVNPDSTLHTRSRCARCHDSAINAGPRTATAKPLPFLFSSDSRQNAPRLCGAISIGYRRLTYLSQISLCSTFYSSPTVFVAKLIKRRAHFFCVLRCLFQMYWSVWKRDESMLPWKTKIDKEIILLYKITSFSVPNLTFLSFVILF